MLMTYTAYDLTAHREGVPNGDGPAFIALSASCDGIAWAPFIVLSLTQARRLRGETS